MILCVNVGMIFDLFVFSCIGKNMWGKLLIQFFGDFFLVVSVQHHVYLIFLKSDAIIKLTNLTKLMNIMMKILFLSLLIAISSLLQILFSGGKDLIPGTGCTFTTDFYGMAITAYGVVVTVIDLIYLIELTKYSRKSSRLLGSIAAKTTKIIADYGIVISILGIIAVGSVAGYGLIAEKWNIYFNIPFRLSTSCIITAWILLKWNLDKVDFGSMELATRDLKAPPYAAEDPDLIRKSCSDPQSQGTFTPTNDSLACDE